MERKPGHPFAWERNWRWRTCQRCYEWNLAVLAQANEGREEPLLNPVMLTNPNCLECHGTGAGVPERTLDARIGRGTDTVG